MTGLAVFFKAECCLQSYNAICRFVAEFCILCDSQSGMPINRMLEPAHVFTAHHAVKDDPLIGNVALLLCIKVVHIKPAIPAIFDERKLCSVIQSPND